MCYFSSHCTGNFHHVQVAWPVARACAIWACTISGMGRRYSSFSLDLKRAFPCSNFALVNEETNEHQQKAWSWPIVRSLTRQPCKENYHRLRSFCSIDCTHFQVSKYLLPSEASTRPPSRFKPRHGIFWIEPMRWSCELRLT